MCLTHLREQHPIHVVDGLRSKVTQHCWDGRCLGRTELLAFCDVNVCESCYVHMYLIH